MQSELSVIIVTWNGLRYLPDCLSALMQQLPGDAEVVVVDNGSTDGTATWLRTAHPSARLVALATNTGFAGGAAAGLRVARGALLMLLNNDAFVEPGCIAALCEALHDRSDAGAAGAVLTFAHQPELVASAGIRVGCNGLALDLWAGRHVRELPEQPQPVFGPSGAAAVYRRTMLEAIGLPEPGYFAYLEDVDLAWRALLGGWSSIVVPAARARHIYSATSVQGSPFKQRLLGRNRIRTLVRCMPGALVRRCLWQIMVYEIMAIGYGLIARQPALIAGRMDALRELPQLLEQRRQIQAQRRVPISTIASRVERAQAPWQIIRDQRHLEAILQRRSADLTAARL